MGGLVDVTRATASRLDRLLPARTGLPLGDRVAALELPWTRRQRSLQLLGLLSLDRQSTVSRPMALPPNSVNHRSLPPGPAPVPSG